MVKVIDISEHNGNIDFLKVKKSGINKVIIRVGWIGNKNNHTQDRKFIEYITLANHANLEIGIYVYSYCSSVKTLETGINWMLQVINPYKNMIKLPVFLDLEDISITGLNKIELTQQAKKFCEILQNNGYIAGIYANKYWWENKLNAKELEKYKIWLAQYAKIEKPNVNFRVDLWQYSSTEKVDGINSNVDMNKCFECENGNIEDITGEQGGYEMKKYVNGSTKENVFQDLQCSKQIGFLNPREECICLGEVDNTAIILYNIDNTNNKKVGFVKWLGGIK